MLKCCLGFDIGHVQVHWLVCEFGVFTYGHMVGILSGNKDSHFKNAYSK